MALGLTVALGGCDGCQPRDGDAPRVVVGDGDPTLARLGVIEGIVRLAPGAELPRYPENPTVVAGREALPSECTPPRTDDALPVRQAEGSDGLVGLTIVVTDAAGDDEGWPAPREPVQHELTIRDCRLSPSVIVATRGDTMRLVNETDYPFFPGLGEGVLQAILRAEPREVPLDRGGVRTIQCGFAAPCGRTEVVVLYHPLHAVTGADGRFRIEGVPVDREVRVTAWHPLFLEAQSTTTVASRATATVELEIQPAAPVALPPVEPPPEGHPEDTTPPGTPF